MRKLLAFAFSAGLALSARAGVPKPIFEAPFDGSPDATVAGGQKTPLAASGLTYVPGVKGQAVKVGKDAQLEYSVLGNLVQEHGTVVMWFRPNWRASDMSSGSKDWHTVFVERLPAGVDRIGSGALQMWFWGPVFRADISDAADGYKTAGSQGLDPTKWAHLAMTWDIKQGSRLYMNGIAVGVAGDGQSPLDLKKGKDFSALAKKFQSFYVGSAQGWQHCDGAIDEMRIYDRALTPAEISSDMAQVSPMHLDCLTSCVMEGADAQVRWRLTNRSNGAADSACKWKFTRVGDGQVLAQGQVQPREVAAGASVEMTAKTSALAKGLYALTIEPARGPAQSASIWALGRSNPYLKGPGALQTTPVETIDLVKGISADRLVVRGNTKRLDLAGRSYLEAGNKKNERFAVKVTLPEAGVPYLIEWDYPDDKLRTMEMIAQDAMHPDSDYGLETGVFCGDEYRNSMQTLTHRSILWARSTEAAFIFMTVRDNAPAALSELRISRIVGGLPDGDVKEAAPVNGWTRTLGIQFEDPSIGFDFGIEGQLMPQYEQTLDRLVAYMKFSGQNLLSYPGVWYHGRIGPTYQPRVHEDDFISLILAKFAANGLGFMPTINLHDIPLPDSLTIDATTVADGSLHASPVMILATGRPNPGGFHGTPPAFNPLHPAVRKYIDSQVDEMVDRYAASPAFKGIVLHLTKHTDQWFGTIDAGYNDYCIDAFERDTSVRVPVDRKDPLRGKLYHDWLLANAREKWVQWRCEQIARWYKAMADRISAKRPDLKLCICSYNPTITDYSADPRYGTEGFALTANREAGLDPALLRDAANIILDQTIYPADYRSNGTSNAKLRPALRVEHMQQSAYALLADAAFPWVNMHDRYFEDGIGGATWWWGKTEPLKAPWLREMSWRVSTLNANSRYFLEHYVLPLRYGDVLGYTKGGFLIGTPGVEEPLLAFAKAYRALPAQRFTDVAGSTQTAKVRSLRAGEHSWFYAVNTAHEPAALSVSFDHAPGVVRDLGTGRPLDGKSASCTVQLAPYELRSFSLDGASVIGATEPSVAGPSAAGH